MKYQSPSFSFPVSDGKLTEEEYAIRVGLWKPAPVEFYRNEDLPAPEEDESCYSR